MAKVFKATVYFVDINEGFETTTEVIDYFNSKSRVGELRTFETEQSEEFKWDDSIKINFTDSTKEDLENVIKGKIEYID